LLVEVTDLTRRRIVNRLKAVDGRTRLRRALADVLPLAPLALGGVSVAQARRWALAAEIARVWVLPEGRVREILDSTHGRRSVQSTFDSSGVVQEHTETKTGRVGRSDVAPKRAPPRVAVERAPHDDLVALESELRRCFKRFEGFSCEEQGRIIQAMRTGTPPDIVGILPTGKGKSLTFLMPTFLWKREAGRAMTVVVSPWASIMSGCSRPIVSSIVTSSREVSSTSDWLGRMMLRSTSGSMPKNPNICSTSSRCCAVNRTRQRAQGAACKALITGAILIASGRVPIVHMTVL